MRKIMRWIDAANAADFGWKLWAAVFGLPAGGGIVGWLASVVTDATLAQKGLYIFAGIIIGLLIWVGSLLRISRSQAPREKKGTVEFFSNQDELRVRYPDSWVLTNAHQLYGCLISGHGLMNKNLGANIQRFRQVIVPNPNGQYLTSLKTLCNTYPSLRYTYYTQEINDTIAAAKGANPPVPLRQFDDFIGMTFLICNPHGDDAWAHVSTGLPLLEPDKQQTYRIEKKNNPKAFASIWEQWERMWNESK
jgi:hypothetical protein